LTAAAHVKISGLLIDADDWPAVEAAKPYLRQVGPCLRLGHDLEASGSSRFIKV
jgi:hypothetical protein